VEEEAGKFMISKVGGPSGRTDEETAVFSWTMKGMGRQIVNYQLRTDHGDWPGFGLEAEYVWATYSRGPHSFEVRAQDSKGAYSHTLIWKFTYDVKFPEVVTSAGQRRLKHEK